MKPTVLIVDDNEDIASLFGACLSVNKIDSMIASNVSQARVLLLKHSFSAMLVDFKLGDGIGPDLLHAYGVPPVRILVSGWGVHPSDYPGFQSYLVKPVVCTELIDALNLRLKEKVS